MNMNDIENIINDLVKRNNISTYCNSKKIDSIMVSVSDLTPTFQYQVKCVIVRICLSNVYKLKKHQGLL